MTGSEWRSSRRRAAVAVAVAVAMIAVLMGAPGTSTTDAAFTDQEYTGNTITAGSLGAPSALTCRIESVLGLLANYRVGWTAPPGPAPGGYVVTVTHSSGSPVYTGTAAAGSTSFVISGGLLEGLLVAGTYTITVRATLQAWVGPNAAPQGGTLSGVTGWRCA